MLLVDEDDMVQKGYGWMLKVASQAHQQEVFKYVLKNKKQIKEDGVGMVGGVPTNNVSDGNIDGIGVGQKGEPGVNMRKKKNVIPFRMFTRKQK